LEYQAREYEEMCHASGDESEENEMIYVELEIP